MGLAGVVGVVGVVMPGAASRTHGGPDAHGRARWDFSTNANAAGPCPTALAALCGADAAHYPDPGYRALRQRLAEWHGVASGRIVVAASASEFIQRLTAVGARLAPGPVAVPAHAYGDYAAAARAWGRPIAEASDPAATLRWSCDPSSPLGQDAPPPAAPTPDAPGTAVLDAVYAPLRLEGASAWDETARGRVFELHSPNKALGLTGVRGAYAIAPAADGPVAAWLEALDAAAPSWPLGAHAVALLDAWVRPEAQQWLAESRQTLLAWKRSQLALLREAGVEVLPSVANFFCARLPAPAAVRALRALDIAVRDAASFGLPGWVRLSVQPPAAQAALGHALRLLAARPARAEGSAR